MSTKKIISFFASLMAGVIIIYLAFAVLILTTFSLRGRTLVQVENEQLLYLFFWLTLAVIGAITTYFFWKRKKKFSASGIGLVSLLPMVAAVVMAFRAITTIPTTEEFLSEEWRRGETKSFLMAKSVVKSDMLNEKSEADVLKILDVPKRILEKSYSDDMFIYQTDSASWVLRVHLADNKVQGCELFHPGLSK